MKKGIHQQFSHVFTVLHPGGSFFILTNCAQSINFAAGFHMFSPFWWSLVILQRISPKWEDFKVCSSKEEVPHVEDWRVSPLALPCWFNQVLILVKIYKPWFLWPFAHGFWVCNDSHQQSPTIFSRFLRSRSHLNSFDLSWFSSNSTNMFFWGERPWWLSYRFGFWMILDAHIRLHSPAHPEDCWLFLCWVDPQPDQRPEPSAKSQDVDDYYSLLGKTCWVFVISWKISGRISICHRLAQLPTS